MATLNEKTMEDVCDVFLWPEGDFVFQPRGPVIKDSVVINLDPIHLVFEGIRRNELWSRLNAVIHPGNLFERSSEFMDDKGAWEDVRVAKHVFVHLDGNVTVADLVERLPFSRYKIYRAVSELLERRLLVHSDLTAAADRQRRTERKLGDAQKAAADGRWTEAIEILQGLLASNPGRQDLMDELLSVTRRFEQTIYEHYFAKEDVPVVTIGTDALSRVRIEPSDGFVLSRIDGRLTVRDILRISPVTEFDGLRSFKRLLAARLIDFPTRKGPPENRPASASR